jgi:DNA-binding transcriptional LysR family regulator
MQDRVIRYVVFAARYGTFTAAAERIGVTQSAITKSIGELEQTLGFAIFERTARGVLVTTEGSAFVERASRLLEDLDQLMRAPQRVDPYAGPLRVGIGPAVLEWLLMKPIAEVFRRYPQVKIEMSSATFDRTVEQLRNGSIDVALGLEAAWAELPEFRRDKMPQMTSTYFTRLGHPLLEMTNVPRSELAKYDFVVPSISRPYGADIRDIFESQGVDPKTRMHSVDYFPLVKLMVSRSDAVGVTSPNYAKTPEFTSRFGAIDLEEPIHPEYLCCATRARWEPIPIVRAFISACRETLPKFLATE